MKICLILLLSKEMEIDNNELLCFIYEIVNY